MIDIDEVLTRLGEKYKEIFPGPIGQRFSICGPVSRADSGQFFVRSIFLDVCISRNFNIKKLEDKSENEIDEFIKSLILDMLKEIKSHAKEKIAEIK